MALAIQLEISCNRNFRAMKIWKCPYCEKETITLGQKALMALFNSVRCKNCGMSVFEEKTKAVILLLLHFLFLTLVTEFLNFKTWPLLAQAIFILGVYLSSFLSSISFVDVVTSQD